MSDRNVSRSLVDQVAIVTGASSGIGAATARELGRRGASVVLAARRVRELEAQVRVIDNDGGTAVAIPADLTSATQMQLLVDRAVATFGRVDVLVNNAGASWSKAVVASSTEELARLVTLNVLGAMILTRSVLPSMLARRHGSIIFVGSLSGRVAMEPVYSATKYGVRGFSLALRRQLAGSGISVSLVSPGKINTAMTANVGGRLPEPELVATKIADLIRHPRREVVIPRRHYAIAWLEEALPTMADLAYRWRHWSPVREEETATWTS
jgi:short-subunit dehydrogenase